MYGIDFEKGVKNIGDTTRLKNTFVKALNGEDITIGFIGGSITQGSLASTEKTCYAYLVYSWFKRTFPKIHVNYVNAGIGGTGSDLGVSRVDDDLLRFKPDVTIVEFSVNDREDEHFFESYEGLVRHILSDPSDTGLILVFNVRYDTMESAEDIHLKIGRHYDVPCLSMRSSVYQKVADGTIKNRDITPDDLHPNDEGHKLLAELILRYLDMVYESSKDLKYYLPIYREIKGPLSKNTYEHSKRYNNLNSEPECNGFEADNTVQERITQMFRHGYSAWHLNDEISFTVNASSLEVMYRKSVNKPTPIAEVIIDGDESSKVVLDGNFTEEWGDCLYTEIIKEHLEKKEHTVRIIITEDHPGEDVVPFYLVGVIGAY